ncbi:phage holin family protein [Faecalibacterium prausnitzii]|uniref:phage holin family protein n=1 Tax=Faecalibacterium prausnitzii TaxID=853 RepID=UPI0032B3F211
MKKKISAGTLTRTAALGLALTNQLLIVLVACQLDAVIGGSFVRDAAIIGFSANEAISIVENAGLMGLPIPAAITKAIDILKQRAETPEKGKN